MKMGQSVGMMGMMRGMGMMGKMKQMGGASDMTVPTALPGFPGASKLYHIGATGFFLDHGEHLKLAIDQQSQLNKIKEKTALDQASGERKIEEAEQDLWKLTAGDQPDVNRIEKKIREIEKIRGDQRLSFIRAVGDAAKILTHEQHEILAGKHDDKKNKDHSGH